MKRKQGTGQGNRKHESKCRKNGKTDIEKLKGIIIIFWLMRICDLLLGIYKNITT